MVDTAQRYLRVSPEKSAIEGYERQ